MNPKTQKKQT